VSSLNVFFALAVGFVAELADVGAGSPLKPIFLFTTSFAWALTLLTVVPRRGDSVSLSIRQRVFIVALVAAGTTVLWASADWT
jgi:hypothetical protein